PTLIFSLSLHDALPILKYLHISMDYTFESFIYANGLYSFCVSFTHNSSNASIHPWSVSTACQYSNSFHLFLPQLVAYTHFLPIFIIIRNNIKHNKYKKDHNNQKNS